jgi:hypothetical protein
MLAGFSSYLVSGGQRAVLQTLSCGVNISNWLGLMIQRTFVTSMLGTHKNLWRLKKPAAPKRNQMPESQQLPPSKTRTTEPTNRDESFSVASPILEPPFKSQRQEMIQLVKYTALAPLQMDMWETDPDNSDSMVEEKALHCWTPWLYKMWDA